MADVHMRALREHLAILKGDEKCVERMTRCSSLSDVQRLKIVNFIKEICMDWNYEDITAFGAISILYSYIATLERCSLNDIQKIVLCCIFISGKAFEIQPRDARKHSELADVNLPDFLNLELTILFDINFSWPKVYSIEVVETYFKLFLSDTNKSLSCFVEKCERFGIIYELLFYLEADLQCSMCLPSQRAIGAVVAMMEVENNRDNLLTAFKEISKNERISSACLECSRFWLKHMRDAMIDGMADTERLALYIASKEPRTGDLSP